MDKEGGKGALSPPQTPAQLAFLANFFGLSAPLQTLVPGYKIVGAGCTKDETGFYDEWKEKNNYLQRKERGCKKILFPFWNNLITQS